MEFQKINYETLARYLSGECSEEESNFVKRMMNEDPELATLVTQFEKIRATRRASLTQTSAENAWIRLDKRIESAELLKRNTPDKQVSHIHTLHRIKLNHKRLLWLLRAAAVLFVAGLTSLFIYMYMDADQNGEKELQEVVTKNGQRSKVHMIDGSRILVNSKSMITYRPFTPDDDSRTVHMSGEAIFEVASDNRTFYVHTDEVVIQALGTEFAVRSYQGEDTRVSVMDGSAAVKYLDQPDESNVYLKKGDMVTMPRDNKTAPMVSRNVDLDLFVGWRDYRFTFNNATLQEVARELERVYGVEIEFLDPEMRNRRISTRFEGESIQKVLRIIQIALDIEYKSDGDKVHFYDKNPDEKR